MPAVVAAQSSSPTQHTPTGSDLASMPDPREQDVSNSFATEMLEVVRQASQRMTRERVGDDYVPVRMRPRLYNDSDDEDERGKLEIIDLPPVPSASEEVSEEEEGEKEEASVVEKSGTNASGEGDDDSQPVIRGSDVAAMFGGGGFIDDFDDNIPASFSLKVSFFMPLPLSSSFVVFVLALHGVPATCMSWYVTTFTGPPSGQFL